MLRKDAFNYANSLELAQFLFNCGYEDLLASDPRNPAPQAYACFWRSDDLIVVPNSQQELRTIAQGLYDGSHVKTQPDIALIKSETASLGIPTEIDEDFINMGEHYAFRNNDEGRKSALHYLGEHRLGHRVID